MKVLILSCNTGGGHNAAGKAMEQALKERGHDAVFLDYLTLSGERVSQMVGGCYVNMVKYVPWLFGGIYQLGLSVSKLLHGHKSPVYYANALMAKKLGSYIEENCIDAVLMPHLYPAETLTYLKKHGARLPILVAIGTDYTCIPFWEETDCDCMILPGEDLIEEFADRGIPREKLYPLGIPVSPDFLRAKQKDREELRRRAGIAPDEKVYLVMGGSMGFGKMELFVKKLCRQCQPGERVIVICGNNKALGKRLACSLKGCTNVKILGYTTHVAEYMAISDVVYTKPGGLTTTEVAVMEKPLIHTAPIPGCETCNARYFAEKGMSCSVKSIGKGIEQGTALMHSDLKRQKMKRQQKKYINSHAAEDICILLETLYAEQKQ